MKLDSHLSPYIKINSGWTKDYILDGSCQRKTGKIVQDKRRDRDFLIAKEIIPRTSKWDYIKSKGFCTAREKNNHHPKERATE